MKYAHRNAIVSVFQVEEDGVLFNELGDVPVLVGDYIATDLDGKQRVIPKRLFEEYYVPVEVVEK